MGPPSQSTINDLLAALNELHSKNESLRLEQEVLLRQITNIQGALEFFSNSDSVPIRSTSDPDVVVEHDERVPPSGSKGLLKLMPMHQWTRELDGLTQFRSLVRIAELNGGEVRPTEAAGILVATGQGKGKPRNLSSGLYALLQRSEMFEKVNPGTFRLVAQGPHQVENRLWAEQNGTESAVAEATEAEA